MKPVPRKFLLRTTAAAALLGLATSPLLAGTYTSPLQVSVSVPAACTVTATPLAFPNYVSGQPGNDDTTSTVTVNCSADTSVTVTADMGLHGSGTQRNVSNGTHTLMYNIYTDTFTTIWGDGTSGTGTFGPTTTSGGTKVFTANGRIPGSQTADANTTYTDTVTVTVNF